MRPVFVYGGIRILLFAVALAVCLLVGINPYLATVIAAIIALCIAYIAFAPMRRAAAEALASRRRDGDHIASADGDDEHAEDAALEGDRRSES